MFTSCSPSSSIPISSMCCKILKHINVLSNHITWLSFNKFKVYEHVKYSAPYCRVFCFWRHWINFLTINTDTDYYNCWFLLPLPSINVTYREQFYGGVCAHTYWFYELWQRDMYVTLVLIFDHNICTSSLDPCYVISFNLLPKFALVCLLWIWVGVRVRMSVCTWSI